MLEIILIVAFFVLPTAGYVLGACLSAGKAEDAWNEGYIAGLGDGMKRA